MKQLITDILETLFPLRPDAKVLQGKTVADFHALMRVQSAYNSLSLLPYSHELVRATIHELKFHRSTHAQALLGEVLRTHLLTSTIANPLLVPIPLSKERRRSRGFNQVKLITDWVSKQSGIPTNNTVLTRVRNTAPQTSLNRQQRLQNLNDAFVVHASSNSINLSSFDVLLIDDVTTTGATMAAAKAALHTLHPRSITCIALAH